MKKLTTLTLALSVVTVGAFAQIQRQTLLEVFTSSTCGPCTPGNAKMEAVLPTIQNYTVVKYQQNFPGSGDPYYTSESVGRRNYYSINSIPRMEIDGQWDQNAQSFTSSIFGVFNAAPTDVDFTWNEYSYDPVSKEVIVDVDVNPHADNATPTLRLMIAIVEKVTTGNVASNGETIFHNVFMNFLPLSSGTSLGALTKDVSINVSASKVMDGSTNVEEITDLRAVIWVEDFSGKKIINSAWMDLRDVKFNGVEDNNAVSDVRVYPNPFTTNANVDFELTESTNVKIQLVDMMGKVVADYGSTNYPAGTNRVVVDGSDLNNGMYLVNMVSESGTTTHRLVLNK